MKLNYQNKISYRNKKDHYGNIPTQQYDSSAPSSSLEDIKFDKNLNKQYTLGIQQQTQYLEKQKSQLLKLRQLNQSNDLTKRKKTELSFDYGSHQYIEVDNSPSPKFKTKQQFSANQNHQNQPIVSKIKKLKPFVNKIIDQSHHQNNQVQQGLRNLKAAHFRIMKQLNQETVKNNSTNTIKYKNQGNTHIKKNISDKMNQLKRIIEKIMRDYKSEGSQIKQSLENMKNIQKSLGQGFEGEDYYDYGPKLKNKESLQIDSFQLQKQKSLFSGNQKQSYQASQQNNQQIDQVNIQSQIKGLNTIEIRIFQQITKLREQKSQLISLLKQQKRKVFQIAQQFKKLYKSYTKMLNNTTTKRQDQSYDSQSIISKLKKNEGQTEGRYYQKLQQNKLKKKIKKLEQEMNKLKNTNHFNNDLVQLKKITQQQNENIENLNIQIKQLQKQIEHKNHELNSNNKEFKNLAEENQNLKNQMTRMENYIRQIQKPDRNTFNRKDKNIQMRQQLKKLKQQNQQLRIQTIRLLKQNSSNKKLSMQQQQSYHQQKYYMKLPKYSHQTKANESKKFNSFSQNNSKNDSATFQRKQSEGARLKQYRQVLSNMRNLQT